MNVNAKVICSFLLVTSMMSFQVKASDTECALVSNLSKSDADSLQSDLEKGGFLIVLRHSEKKPKPKNNTAKLTRNGKKYLKKYGGWLRNVPKLSRNPHWVTDYPADCNRVMHTAHILMDKKRRDCHDGNGQLKFAGSAITSADDLKNWHRSESENPKTRNIFVATNSTIINDFFSTGGDYGCAEGFIAELKDEGENAQYKCRVRFFLGEFGALHGDNKPPWRNRVDKVNCNTRRKSTM